MAKIVKANFKKRSCPCPITKGQFYGWIALISIASICIWASLRIINYASFYNRIEGQLNNYQDAATTEKAIESLDKVISKLEENDLTEGQISIFLNDPNENIGVFYNNLVMARENLVKAQKETLFEQASILEKQKEAIDGSIPAGISIYPHNKGYFWWSILSMAVLLNTGIMWLYLLLNYKREEPLWEEKKKTA